MTYLVTGATGNIGRLVVEELSGAGVAVRALSRNPDAAALPASVPVVAGDLAVPESLAAALRGVTRMYLFPMPETARQVVELARDAGVERIVVLSSDAVTDSSDPGHHRPVELAVEESGLAWTHLRPGEFALNKLDMWSTSIRFAGEVRSAYAQAHSAPVHERDVAAVAAAALLRDGYDGRALRLTGPLVQTQREQVASIAEGIGRAIRFEELTPDQARAEMVRGGLPGHVADYILAFQAKWVHEPVEVSTAVEEITGRPARTLAQWAADHADGFR